MDNLSEIRFIATGLVKWQDQYDSNGSFYPIPKELLRGINTLAAKSIESNELYPKDYSEIIQFLSTPLGQWDGFELKGLGAGEALLEYGQPSDLCYELHISGGDVEDELTQGKILGVMNTCKGNDDQEGYVNFRRKIIQDKVISKHKLIKWSNDPRNSTAANKILDFFEEIPPYGINSNDGSVYICQYCGWTVEWDRENKSRCHSSLCRHFTNNFRRIKKEKEKPENLFRLKRGPMRYTSKPGIYELKLEKKLLSLGLRVEMWPGFDQYDLRIIFPDGEIWGVDVKDYSNSYILVASLKEFPQEPYSHKGFFVVPQYRSKSNHNFERVFEAQCRHRSINVSLRMENNFINQVKSRLEGRKYK